jgi:hypothetical protein
MLIEQALLLQFASSCNEESLPLVEQAVRLQQHEQHVLVCKLQP